MTANQKIERLKGYSERLRESLYQAKSLYACFQSLNANVALRERINCTEALHAARLIQNSLLRELILIIVRVLDRPGGDVEKSDKVSFPVIAAYLEQEELRRELIATARNWLGGALADEQEDAARGAMDSLSRSLDRLSNEEPNRQKRLRDFRNGFLAHELHREVPRDLPIFGHIGELLDEIRLLCEASSLAVEGTSIHWDGLEEDVKESSDWLWQRVAGGRDT